MREIKKILKTIFMMFGISAATAFTVRAIITIIEGDLSYINYFGMLSLEYFMPGISRGWLSHVLSFIMIAGLFFVIYRYLSGPLKNRQE